MREVAAYLRRHDKKRDGSCRQAALEKTLHWTGIIHELQPLEVEDLLGALKLEQVTRRGEPVVDYALFLRQVLGDDALQAYPERGVVNRGPGTSRKERPTTARRRRYDSEEIVRKRRSREGDAAIPRRSYKTRRASSSGLEASLAEFLEEGAKRGQLTASQFSRCLEDVAQELDVDEVLSRRDVDSLLNDIGDGRRIRVEDLLQECGLDGYDENDDYPTSSKKYPRTPAYRGRRRGSATIPRMTRTNHVRRRTLESRRRPSRIGNSRKSSTASARR